MNGQPKLRWVNVPRHSLRRGLACDQGGVRVMLLLGEDRKPVGPAPAAASPRHAQADARPAEKPR